MDAPAPQPANSAVRAQFIEREPIEAWCPESMASIIPELSACQHKNDECIVASEPLPGGWFLVGASKRGRAHAHQGEHREDAFGWFAANDKKAKSAVLAVSDGAGSSEYSRIGSSFSVKNVLRSIKERLDFVTLTPGEKAGSELRDIVEKSIESVCLDLCKLAKSVALDEREFRCTLLVLILYQFESGEAMAYLAQIGDGACLGITRKGEVIAFSRSEVGNYSGEVGCFIPENCAMEGGLHVSCIPFEHLRSIQAFILCTDGIDDPFYPLTKNAPTLLQQLSLGTEQVKIAEIEHVISIDPIFDKTHAGDRLLKWLDFRKRGENDDRTLFVLHRE